MSTPARKPLAAVAPPDAMAEVGASLKALTAASRRLRGRETHRQDGLSYAQYSLLFGLADVAELPSSELARHADLTPGSATQMLDALEGAGLVTRRRSPDDRRVVLTALTERGAAVVAARRAQIEPRWRAALEGFSDDDLRAAAAVMARIAALFDAMHEEA